MPNRLGSIAPVPNVSYLRTPAGDNITVYSRGRSGASAPRRRRAPWFVAGGLGVIVLVLAAAAAIISTSKPKLTSAPTALAKIDMPLGGGSVGRVVATTGPQNNEHFVRMIVKGDPVVYPARKLKAGEKLTVTAEVHRPGWISWLTGRTQRITRTITVPTTDMRTPFVTLSKSGDLVVRFSKPVRTVAYGASAGTLHRHTLGRAQTTVTVPHSGSAGTMYVAATVQRWETGHASTVSWFPAGTKATAVAQPRAGATIKPDTPITLTFSKPIARVFGHHLPTVSPAGAGHWQKISSHAIRFQPAVDGYGLGQKVSIGLPAGVRLAGATQTGSASTGTWHVPAGSTVRLNQLLAQLGYLPMKVGYTSARPALTVAAQTAAAVSPPKATVSWDFADTPAGLKSQWSGDAGYGELTKAAVMKFENDHNMTADGVDGPAVWKALIRAEIKDQRNTFGYTFVSVSEGSPESLFVWHSGKTVLSSIPVNTGIASAPTATGTFAVFEHIPVTTMTGNNPDGSTYSDPGIKWVSYFNGGDALHEFLRGSYGFPQSVGCVEMADANAQSVYPFTPIGTVVQVNA